MGNFLNQLGTALCNTIRKFPHSQICKNTSVNQLRLHQNQLISVSLSDKNGQNESFIGKNVILTIGAKQYYYDILNREIFPNFNLIPYKDKVIVSGEILNQKISTITRLKQMLPNKPKIVIIAGSHSAWSCAWYMLNKLDKLLDKPIHFERSAIKILHRSDIKLFYSNRDDAINDNYKFNEFLDICPLSGRVNRFSGLRGDAFELAREVINENSVDNPIKLITLSQTMIAEIKEALDVADLIVPAFGYRASTVPILDEKDNEIELAFNDTGLVVDHMTRVIKKNGEPINNILAYGLGAGMMPSNNVGGEQGLNRRVDGVWLFQNDVGKIAFSTIASNLNLNVSDIII